MGVNTYGYDLLAHVKRAMTFSEKTFGPGGNHTGVVAHIRKELEEIEQKPSDLMEWIDVIILGIDGAWRATGSTAEQIVSALEAKQSTNERRTWPDWRTVPKGTPIEHIED